MTNETYHLLARFGTILFISGSKTGFVKILLRSKSYFWSLWAKECANIFRIFFMVIYVNVCSLFYFMFSDSGSILYSLLAKRMTHRMEKQPVWMRILNEKISLLAYSSRTWASLSFWKKHAVSALAHFNKAACEWKRLRTKEQTVSPGWRWLVCSSRTRGLPVAPTVICSAFQQKSTFLQDPEVSDANEVVVDPRHFPITREPRRTWKGEKAFPWNAKNDKKLSHSDHFFSLISVKETDVHCSSWCYNRNQPRRPPLLGERWITDDRFWTTEGQRSRESAFTSI